MSRNRRSSRVAAAVILVVLLGLAGGVLLLSIMPHGIGVSSDSILYLLGADSLRDGKGWSRPSGGGTMDPITHFPPLYSLVLAGAAGQDGTPLRAAAATGAVLFAGVILATGLALIFVDGSPAAGVVAALVLAVSPILLSVFSWAMSEPLFLLLGLLSFICLVVGLRGRSTVWIVLAGAAAGLGYLTRYVGVALIATGILLVLLRTGWDRRERIQAVAAFTLPAAFCIAAWSFRNLALSGTATNRSLVWHAISITKLKAPLALLWNWLLPFEFDSVALLVSTALLVGLLLGGGLVLVRKWADVRREVETWRRWPSLAVAVGTYLVVYSGMVALSILFVDAATPANNRIAAPVYLSLVIVLSEAWVAAFRKGGSRGLRPVLLIAAIVLVGTYIGRSREVAEDLMRDGQGYASEGWQRSPVIAAARRFPPDSLFFTDNTEVFTFFTGVGAFGLPDKRDGVTGLANPHIGTESTRILHELDLSGGAVVLFGGPGSEAEWRHLAPLLSELELVAAVSDGRIYSPPDPG